MESSNNTGGTKTMLYWHQRLAAFCLLCSTLWVVSLSQAAIQQHHATVELPTTFWPEGIAFDGSITTPKQFFGFEIGQRHLDHGQLASYLRLIADESPRIQLQQTGQTDGGRPLLLLTISSTENLSQLPELKKTHRQLADPESSATVELENLPAVINMGYGVHGDEASATNCAALVAYYLAAAEGEQIEKWLSSCIILLDPCLNPDGFNRFANWVNAYRGVIPNDDPQHREHQQSWPAGRVNYYWFDLNRDWLPVEHTESRTRMSWYHEWKPNVVLDFHEMGTNSTYFFQPGVPNRTYPLTPQKNIELTAKFGAYHGKALDSRGSYYFTRERFDDFYMGKGSTYPDLHGAVGILFEQASARGHVQRNQDGRLTFYKAIANHFATSRSSLQATTQLRQELLAYKRQFYIDSSKSAKQQDHQAIAFMADGNYSRLHNFADVLLRHDIRCYWPQEDLVLDGKVFKPNRALLVPVQQSEFRFLQALFSREKNFPENVFYDVSSWTLPLAYNLNEQKIKEKLDLSLLRPAELASRRKLDFQPSDQAIAYLVDWRDDSACWLLSQLLKNDINVKLATRPFSAVVSSDGQTRSFQPGTVLIQLAVQDSKRGEIEQWLAKGAERGSEISSVFSGLAIDGVDLGSSRFRKLKPLRIAMPVGSGVSQYEAGEIWHSLDKRQQIPLSLLKEDRIGQYNLRQYSTFLFPSGNYHNVTASDWERIAVEVKQGATTIAIGRSAEMIGEKLTGTGKDIPVEPDAPPVEKAAVQLPFNSAEKSAALQLISGAIFDTVIDRTHPLFFGFPSDRLPVFRNHANFLMPSENQYCNPGIYDREVPHLAGYCSDTNIEKFKHSTSVVVVPIGQGRLIQISDNPNFRAFWHGTNRLFLNAVFFGDLVNAPRR